MKLPNVMRAVLDQPWAISPGKLDQVLAVLEMRCNGRHATPEDIRAALGGEGTPQSMARIAGGVAVLPLHGVCVPRASGIEESSGVQSLQRFGSWIDEAVRNEAVGTLLLDIDSPGGSVGLVAETWQKLMDARAGGKKVVAHVNTLAASAAYWIASAADEIVCTPSGDVGSIGVIMVHADISKAAEQEGVTFTVLTAGKYKGEGSPYAPLDEEATAAIQTRLDDFYSMFTGAVAKGRGVSAAAVRNGFGQGRVLSASAAKAEGMIDRIATMDDTLARLTSRKGGARMRAEAPPLEIAAFVHNGGSVAPLTFGDSVVPLTWQTITGSTAAPITFTTTTAGTFPPPVVPAVSGGEPAAVAVPLPVTAPKAKDHMTPEEIAALKAENDALKVKAQRTEGYTALRKNHPEIVGKIDQWDGAGIPIEQAQAHTRAELQAMLSATQIRVAGPNESGALPNEAKQPFATFGQQLAAIVRAGGPRSKQQEHDIARLSQINAATSGMNEGIGSDGGFAVAPEFLPGIMEPIYSTGEIASRVLRIPATVGNTVTFNVVEETTRATGSRWGGVQFAFAPEGGQGTATRPKLRQVALTLKKAIGLWYATDELLQDSPAMEALAQKAFSTELQFFVEDAFINGQGSGAPLGILNAACTVAQAIEASQTIANSPASIVANVSKMKSRFGGDFKNAVWLANQELEPTFIQATLGGTSAAFPVYMPAGGLSSAPYASILGRPLVFVDYCAAVGTPGDLILADLGQYATIDKGGAVGASSVHLRFDYDETAFRMTYRFDGQPIWKQAVTPYKGALTRSPFVTLATRS